MATFQVVYDDFSGGQYMGSRPANQPKSTWTGTDVVASPNGELIPTGTRSLGTWTQPTAAQGVIVAHFYETTTAYFFTDQARLVKYEHNNAVTTPVTFTAYAPSITGTITSATYSELHGRFYYLTISGTGGLVYNITKTGTNSSFFTFGSGTNPRGITTYKQRLLVWGTNRLYYSGVWDGSTYGAMSSGQYYELDSTIIGVFPRTDDLLIVCEDGTFSLTGVLGSGVNIQTLTPGDNVSGGMKNGAIVNRSFFYLDEFSSRGSSDGRLYRMVGASIQHVATFEYGDYYFQPNGFNTAEPGKVFAMPNGRIGIQFRSGVTYFESTPGVFAKSPVFAITETTTSRAASNYYKPANTMPGAPDEYMLTAVIENQSNMIIKILRTYTNVPAPTKLDANFNFSTNSTCVVNPTGTAELSEYWHSKPFSVKEVFVEYSATDSTSSVSCSIIPTGVVDVPAANLASVVSTAASETNPPSGGYRMYRYWPNNASKGFGVKPQITMTNCFVKRVILNCED